MAVLLMLAGCGTRSGHFKIEGRFLHMNQGELYLYSLDGTIDGFDTIRVNGGRFAFEMPCENPAMLILVFPNLSEQPVFAQSGKTVTVNADASHLKEMEMEGSEDNELMTKFRLQTANASPPEAVKYAEMFINDHPRSMVGTWLVHRYFIQSANPDYNKAAALVETMLKEQDSNGLLIRMKQEIALLRRSAVGSKMPKVTAKDTEGRTFSTASLAKGVAVISVWASWNGESINFQRKLAQYQKESGGKLKLASVCLDADRAECRQTMERDSISWSNICDGQLFDSPLVQKLGIATLPDNIVLRDGIVVARSLGESALREKLAALGVL